MRDLVVCLNARQRQLRGRSTPHARLQRTDCAAVSRSNNGKSDAQTDASWEGIQAVWLAGIMILEPEARWVLGDREDPGRCWLFDAPRELPTRVHDWPPHSAFQEQCRSRRASPASGGEIEGISRVDLESVRDHTENTLKIEERRDPAFSGIGCRRCSFADRH